MTSMYASAAERMLDVLTRGDVEIVPVVFAGEPCFVASDPATLEHFQLTAAERHVLEQLRRPASLAGLQRSFENAFPDRRVTLEQLRQFVDRLYEQRLVLSVRPGQGASLWEQGRRRRSQRRWTSALSWLAIRVGGISADPWIAPLYRWARWFFSPWGWLFSAALAGFALRVLAVRGSEFLADAAAALADPAAFGLMPWVAALVIVKCVHELAHALTCRHVGGECREIGVLLLAGAPTLYCDVSDVWRLPNKWRRIAVTSAGMGAEFLIACSSVIVWNQLPPGALATFCCQLAIVCSLGTLLVNANPLLRYDGYFALSDLTETPNLGERARALLYGFWRRWLLGEPRREDPWLTPRKKWALAVYAVASTLYLWITLGGLAWVLVVWARPRGAEPLALLAVGLFLLCAAARRGWVAARFFQNPWLRSQVRWRRAVLTLAGLAAAGASLWHWPITRRVTAPVALVAADGIPLFTPAAGRLEYAVPLGTELARGDVVARLVDPQLDLAVARQEAALRQAELRRHQLRALRSAQRELPAALAERDALRRELQHWKTQVELLTIRAPRAGRLMPPPRSAPGVGDQGELPNWAGTPLDACNRGAWLQTGTVLGIIAPGDACAAWAAVDPDDAAVVAPGQRVRLVMESRPTHVLEGTVRDVAVRPQENRPGAPPARRRTVASTYHVAEVELDERPSDSSSHVDVRQGWFGAAKIETERTTIGALIQRQLAALFFLRPTRR